MKKEYNIKDRVWIHIGEAKLTEGRVVEIIDLEHLKEGHSPDRELYIIELKTGIDDVYEVRDFDQISPDAKGPINLFRKLNSIQVRENSRYLKKVGMSLPIEQPNLLTTIIEDIDEGLYPDEGAEPTADEIHAAIARSTSKEPIFSARAPRAPAKKPRKRNFVKRKKNDNSNP